MDKTVKLKSFSPLISILLALAFVLSACGEARPQVTSTPTETATLTVAAPTQTSQPGSTEEGRESEADIVESITSRTPEPTPTPGRIDEAVSEFARDTGLSTATFLGVTGEDWINLGISILIAVFGYLLAGGLVGLLSKLLKRTPIELDNTFLEETASQWRWLLTLLVIDFAIARIQFITVEVRTILNDALFVSYLTLIVYILWKLIDFAIKWYRPETYEIREQQRYTTLVTILRRFGRVLLALSYLAILLTHFGINITALVATAGILGLGFSLAAQDTIADAIAGIIILIDQPFRVGDRIEIQDLGTWGDVVDIGVRTTRIRTRDNRLVIVPNSIIGKNQVVNYSYPDPRYRIEMEIGIGYGQDVEYVRQMIVEAVQGVEGVLSDKPVEALYIQMGNSGMIFRVRWWIESYVDTRRMFDRVNTTLQKSLDAAGIELSFTTFEVNLKLGKEELDRLSRPPGESQE